MPESITIPKEKSSFPDYLDFNKLREAGLKHIETLGSDLWTDYNLHDPGITILEVLCYALTDLGYRNNLDIKDLLTRPEHEKTAEEKNLLGQPYDDNFFTAAEILGCNPVTLTDYRKLLIDIPGVRNAWLERAKTQETDIQFDANTRSLQYKAPPESESSENKQKATTGSTDTVPENADTKTCTCIHLNGLYDLYIEIEPQLTTDPCGRVYYAREDIIQQVYEVFHQHRNLAEDLHDVVVFGEENIAVCADVELTPETDPEDALLGIYLKIEEFLAPVLRFYTLQELLEKGRTPDEIFEGRPLSKIKPDIRNGKNCLAIMPNHGFIDTAELNLLDPRNRLFASDIYKEILAVDGVLAVHKLALVNYINDLPQTKGEKWCLPLTPGFRPHIDLDRSRINFYKGPFFFNADEKEVRKRFREERTAKTKTCLDAYQLDLPVPEGEYRDLAEYTLLAHEFPLTYGIGAAGLKDSPTPERIAQARQLKAYLLFFDQILANYLAQLAHVRDLFSMRSDRPGKNRTYFTQPLPDEIGLRDLIRYYDGCGANGAHGQLPDDYPGYLDAIAETPDGYYERRNRFLDHLLARFGESFSDYVVLMYKLSGERRDEAGIIRDKAGFLADYAQLSRDRGKAFNYLDRPVWDTDNLSGLEERVSRLLGIDNPLRQTLGVGNVLASANVISASIQINGYDDAIPDDGNTPPKPAVLSLCQQFPDISAAQAAIERLITGPTASNPELRPLAQEKRYRRLTAKSGGHVEYWYTIVDDEGTALARSVVTFPDLIKLQNDAKTVQENLPDNVSDETNIDAYFRYLEDGRLFEIVLNGKVKLTGEDLFPNKTEAEKVALKVIIAAKNLQNYCRQEGIADERTEYRLAFVGDDGQCVAEDAKTYTNREERDRAMHQFIAESWYGKGRCVVRQENECFHYELYDATGETLLFRSAVGYPSSKEAEDAYDEFKNLALVRDNYVEVTQGEDGPYSFVLTEPEGDVVNDEPVTIRKPIAIHPFFYDTRQEKNDRQQAIIYYLDTETKPPIKPAPPKIGGTPGTYRIEVTDNDGNLLFLSPPQANPFDYRTEVHARQGYQKILRRAREGHLRKLDDLGGDKPFGFELIDRDDCIADHPGRYATAAERDLAMDAAQYGARNQEMRYRVVPDDEGFRFEVFDLYGKTLMRSQAAYPDEPAAEAAWKIFQQLGCAFSNYQRSHNPDAPLPYSFGLLGPDKTVLAVHPYGYATEAERDMAIVAMRNFLCYTEYTVEISGNPGTYTFTLLGNEPSADATDKRELLISVQNFDDLLSAQAAFEKVLVQGQEWSNYQLIAEPALSFFLLDEERRPLAQPPAGWVFTSEAERDAYIRMILAYLRNDPVQFLIPNTGGAFYGEITDADQNVLLVGTRYSASEELARAELATILNLAVGQGNYHPEEMALPDTNCGFGFVLKNSGETVARHPRSYTSAAAGRTAKLNTLAYLSDWTKMEGEVIRERYEYYAYLPGPDADTLKATEPADTESDAITLSLQWPEWAKDENRYAVEKNAYDRFDIWLNTPDGQHVARRPESLPTEEAANETVNAWTLYYQTGGIEPLYEAILAGYYYELKDFEQHVLLSSRGKVEFGPMEKDAAVAQYPTYMPLALDHVQYKSRLRYANGACLYAFEVVQGEKVVFSHPVEYSSTDLRDKAIDDIIRLLQPLSIGRHIRGTTCGYKFEITLEKTATGTSDDPAPIEKKVLVRGSSRYPYAAAAWQAAHRLALLLREENNYKSPADQNDQFLRWIIPQTPPEIARIFKVDNLALLEPVEIKDLLNQSASNLQGHTTPEESIPIPPLGFQCAIQRPTDNALLLTGTSLFTTADGDNSSTEAKKLEEARAKAWEQCNAMCERGYDAHNYALLEDPENCTYGFSLTDRAGGTLAKHRHFYSTAETRDLHLQETVAMLNREGFHLVEHLLLRPKRLPRYRFVIPKIAGPAPTGNETAAAILDTAAPILMRSIKSYINRQDAINDFKQYVLESTDLSFIPIRKTCDVRMPGATPPNPPDVDCYYFRLTSGGVEIAYSENDSYASEAAAQTDIEAVEATIAALNTPDVIDACIILEAAGDHFLPVPGNCLDAAGEICTDLADPYSFRATAVLPWWPERFQQPEFREFVDNTLRGEAPAHLLLRICWVNAQQMNDFEKAYRRWLDTLGLDNLVHCDATAALNNLIDTLIQLRSHYPEANLYACDQSSSGTAVVLNYTKLG